LAHFGRRAKFGGARDRLFFRMGDVATWTPLGRYRRQLCRRDREGADGRGTAEP
jgi:hypothetical protein